jgi:hypothetical protein
MTSGQVRRIKDEYSVATAPSGKDISQRVVVVTSRNYYGRDARQLARARVSFMRRLILIWTCGSVADVVKPIIGWLNTDSGAFASHSASIIQQKSSFCFLDNESNIGVVVTQRLATFPIFN